MSRHLSDEDARRITSAYFKTHQLESKRGPLSADHPLVGRSCPGCTKPIAAGDYIALVTIGPGDDSEARARARAGKFFTAIAVPAHWACVTGEEIEATS